MAMDYEEWKKSTANIDVDGKGGYTQDFTDAYIRIDTEKKMRQCVDDLNVIQEKVRASNMDKNSLKELQERVLYWLKEFEDNRLVDIKFLQDKYKRVCELLGEKVELKVEVKAEVAGPKGKRSHRSKEEKPVPEAELFKEVEFQVKQKNVVEREFNRIILCLEPNQTGQPIKWTDSRTGLTCQMTERWEWINFMATDVMTTKLQKRFEENKTTEDTLDDLEELNVETSDPSFNFAAKGWPLWIKITDEDFRIMTGKNYSSGQIHELLKRTFSVKFSIPYRSYVLTPKRGYVFTDQDRQDFVNNGSNRFYSLGQYGCIEEKFETKKGKVVKRRDHYILFNTRLSLRITKNILNKNINWLPIELYNENPSAQLFHRHYLIDNNFPNIDLLVSTIIKDLGIKTKIKSAVIARLKKNTLTPLHKLGLIKNVSSVKDSFGEVYKFGLRR
jgi:hypothetical protein